MHEPGLSAGLTLGAVKEQLPNVEQIANRRNYCRGGLDCKGNINFSQSGIMGAAAVSV